MTTEKFAAVRPDEAAEPVVMSRGELQDKAIRGALWTLVHVAVSMPIAFVVNVVIARTLGVLDYGRLTYLATIMVIVGSVYDLGVGTGLIQFGTKAHSAGRYGEVKQLLSATQGYRTTVGIPVISAAVLILVDVDPVLIAIAIAFGVVLPCLFSGAGDALAIENKTAQSAQAVMIANLATQVLVVIVAITFRTADSIWIVRLMAGGIGTIVFLFFVSRRYRWALLRPRFARFPRGFWKFALPAGAAGIVEAVVSSRSEVLVLTWMSEPEAAGVFALAFGLAVHLFSPAQALVGPLVPAISGLREVDEDAVGRALTRTLRASSTAMALVVAAALPAFAVLVPVIYGSEFSDVSEVMLTIGAAGGLLVIAGPVKAFVMARLKGTWLLWANLASLAVGTGAMLVLVPHLGVWGAVLGNLIGAVVLFVSLMVTEARMLRIGMRPIVRALSSYIAGLAVAGVTWWVVSHLAWPVIPLAVFAGVLGLVLLTGALWLTRSGLHPHDAHAILSSLPVKGRRVAAIPLRLVTTARR